MKIYDKLVLFTYSFCIAILSIVLVIIPIDFLNVISIEQWVRVIRNIKGNYIYSLIGIIFLIISLRFLVFGFKKTKLITESFLIMNNDLGEVRINSETIVGLIQNTTNKFNAIKNVNTNVEFISGQIDLTLRGEVNQGINIPGASRELQLNVKQDIEGITGCNVRDIRIVISNVISTNRVNKL